jgi:hypothetical protein
MGWQVWFNAAWSIALVVSCIYDIRRTRLIRRWEESLIRLDEAVRKRSQQLRELEVKDEARLEKLDGQIEIATKLIQGSARVHKDN